MNPFLADLLTLITGVFVLVSGQLAQKVFIDPIVQLKRTIADTMVLLVVYTSAGSKCDPPERQLEAKQAFQRAAGALRGDASIIPKYSFWQGRVHLPTYHNLQQASSLLSGLANTVCSGKEETYSKWLSEVTELLS